MHVGVCVWSATLSVCVTPPARHPRHPRTPRTPRHPRARRTELRAESGAGGGADVDDWWRTLAFFGASDGRPKKGKMYICVPGNSRNRGSRHQLRGRWACSTPVRRFVVEASHTSTMTARMPLCTYGYLGGNYFFNDSHGIKRKKPLNNRWSGCADPGSISRPRDICRGNLFSNCLSGQLALHRP